MHTKVLANVARMVQVMGRGTHFMMEQRQASQAKIDAGAMEEAARTRKKELAAAEAAWLTDEVDEPDDEW